MLAADIEPSESGSREGSILVTGANGGLGSAIAAHIIRSSDLRCRYHGIYAVRKAASATTLQKVLREGLAGHNSDVVELELSSLAAVRETAKEINDRIASGEWPRLQAIVLNAAYLEHSSQDFSQDGFDMTWQVNYLSQFLLTLLLLQSMDMKKGRIVILGSYTHDPHDKKNDSIPAFKEEQWKMLYTETELLAKGTWSSSKDYPGIHGGHRRYGASKACAIMMMYELQERLNTDPLLSNISVIGIDPGGMASDLMRRSNFLLRVLSPYIMVALAWVLSWFSANPQVRAPRRSAGDVMRAALDRRDLGQYPKGVYLNGTQQIRTSQETYDQAKRKRLWRDSIKLAHVQPEDTILHNLS